ncbi:MAG: hypothetical protein CL561_08670 [Alphaproteobacteria bacterium]|nr:hypothetical protein [Alphaproteobacteria bacterium]|tara:strand:- start:1456 stop:2274 length:819 start_codon:yes stop_codon:yes gene_type:complete
MAKDVYEQVIPSKNKGSSALRAAAESAISDDGVEQKSQSQREQYLADRQATKENFVANVQAVINSLKDMQGANGNKFYIRKEVQNFKEKDALKDDGTYNTPEIQLAIACNTSMPYDFKYNEWRSPDDVLYKHATYTSSSSKTTHDINMDMNGFFLTQATGTISKRIKPETSYTTKAAIGIFIRGNETQIVRMDQKSNKRWGSDAWDFSLRRWDATTGSVESDSLQNVFNAFSSWVMDNAELSREDLLTLADAIEKPHKPSLWQQIKNKWTLG